MLIPTPTDAELTPPAGEAPAPATAAAPPAEAPSENGPLGAENGPLGTEEAPEEDHSLTGAWVGEDDDLFDAQGNILGKFKDVRSLAKSYDSAQSEMTRKQQEAARYKKTLTDAGYTFDAQGNPVPPPQSPGAPAPEAPATAAGAPPPPAPQPQAAAPESPDDPVRTENGVSYNRLGLPIVPEEEWEALREEDPDAYLDARANYAATRAVRLAAWNQEQQQKQEQAAVAARAEIVRAAKEQYGLADDTITDIEGVAGEIMKNVQPHLRARPDVQQAVMRMAGFDVLARKLADPAEAQRQAEAQRRAPRVVHAERGSSAAPARTPAPKTEISAESRAIMEAAGLSEEEYARYNS